MTSAPPSGPDPTASTGAPSCPTPGTTRGSRYHPRALTEPALTPGHLGLGNGGGGCGGEGAKHSGSCGPWARPPQSGSARAHWHRTAIPGGGGGAEHSGSCGPGPLASTG